MMDFPFSCTIEPRTSETDYEDATYGTPVDSDCNYIDTVVQNQSGSNMSASAWVALPPETFVDINYRITLDNGVQSPISSIKTVKRSSDHEVEYIKVIIGFPPAGGS